MTNEQILNDLQATFGAAVTEPTENFGLLNVTVDSGKIVEIIKHLFHHETFQFQFLTDLAGVHYPHVPGREFSVIYHLHSLQNNVRVVLKAFLPANNIHIPTITEVFACANWMEREAFDFYGIIFDGHPNLIRILNCDDMDYHPMRKEYPLEDATRNDKIDALFGR